MARFHGAEEQGNVGFEFVEAPVGGAVAGIDDDTIGVAGGFAGGVLQDGLAEIEVAGGKQLRQ